MKAILRIGALVSLTALRAVPCVLAQDRETDWGRVEFSRDAGLTRGRIPGTPDSAWRVLKRLVEEAGIRVTIAEPANGLLGTRRVRAVRRLGRSPISTFLSCGENMTGPNADTYHVFLTLLATISPTVGGGTAFQLEFHGDAVDVPGGRPERLPCSTTGRLEQRLVDRLDAVFPGTK